ncbi:MAG TPA: lysylphosphatidylglycerol synthase transmembrane domain-containing protein [Anaerolineales bacterium]|nr:lysylphosphatidylglycerol synthase transmembrane domain-containing protein [Anaerolineales bacterium]
MKRWQLWLGVAISIFFLWLVLRDLDFAAFWAQVRAANYWWLLPGVAVYMIAVWVRAWRWHYLLRPLKAIPTGAMFPIVAIGYMGNNIYPARAGEVLRAYVLKKKEGVAISASLATIIVERIFDGVVMLGFIFVNLGELARLTKTDTVNASISIQLIAFWGSVVFFGALLVFLLAAMFPAMSERILDWLATRLVPHRFRKGVLETGGRFLGGLEALRSPLEILMVFLTSVVIWLLETGKYWFVMHAFNFEVSFFALMLMNGVVNLATTIPSAPGYVGTFDAPGIAVLEAYGIPHALASGYTFVLHFALWLPITLLGAYYLAREGIQWGKVPTEANTS